MEEKTYEGISFSSIIKTVEKLVEKSVLLTENPRPKNKSGYFTMMDRETGEILFVWKIGNPPKRKAGKYCRLSQEKAKRLYRNLKNGHLSSYQSRDPKKGKWGGAIVADVFILSFSGLAEKIDEPTLSPQTEHLVLNIEDLIHLKIGDFLID